MLPEFYIFKKQARGSARWLEVVSDLEAAKLRVKELAESMPGDYFFVFSLEAGRRLDLNDLKHSEDCSGTELPT